MKWKPSVKQRCGDRNRLEDPVNRASQERRDRQTVAARSARRIGRVSVTNSAAPTRETSVSRVGEDTVGGHNDNPSNRRW